MRLLEGISVGVAARNSLKQNAFIANNAWDYHRRCLGSCHDFHR